VKGLLLEVKEMVDQLVQGEDEIAKWVEGRKKAITRVERIPGDASTRRYYRIHTQERSFILMKAESFSQEGMSWPFLVVQKHLETCGIDVPQVFDVDADRGYVLLEDLGDITLLRKLQDVSSKDVERSLYENVLNSLVDLHIRAAPEGSGAKLEAFKLRFDHEKLFWEVNFTVEHFYDKYLARTFTAEDRKIMLEGLSEICWTLDKQPTVFTHRDFHSRNVMVCPKEGGTERFAMIDFQDARMGPAQYDLASLLRDSYYQLEESQIDLLLDYYVARYAALSGQTFDRTEFRRVFDLMSVQRNFKAIGSFASFLNRRGNPGYLKYIGNTFENIRRTLLKYPEYSRLREVLFHYYYF
jgi:aminoglycoside/choline kinase family phosphotransferase